MHHPDVYRVAKNSGHERPDVKTQAVLNLQGERQSLDAMERGLERSDCQVASYEHDGLYVWLPPWAEERSPNFAHWKEDMVNNARPAGCSIPVKEKPVPHFDDILRRFEAALPGDWETKVENWEEQLQIVQQARPGARWARQDRLYAEIVALEAEPYLGFAWGVRELFKHAGKGSLPPWWLAEGPRGPYFE